MLMLAFAEGTAAQAQGVLARARETGKVTIGIFNQAPWGFVDTNGEVKGQSVDVAKAALALLGITKVEPVVTEFGALVPGLQARRFDVIAAGFYIKPERCKVVAFGNPDIRMTETFLVMKGNPKSLHSYTDVAKSSAILAVNRGSVDVGYATDAGVPKERLMQVPDVPSGLSALLAGRADAFAATIATITAMAAANNTLERAEPFAPPVDAEGKVKYDYSAVAFREADSDFRDAYNGALKKLHESGKLLEILKKYGYSENEVPPVEVTAGQLCNR
ncbi:ectoine/hydroxyectoine ABC transporter substrate-binding protein EhuB [Bradyrhizobium sp. B097]|uniref:ectoine/hydroxyectoine ABC transporter substrate-binding protein EhuB n=1 Tax=Bradyrhizobium sp. B097 TaxID=3140244 RepID=UPI003183C8CE